MAYINKDWNVVSNKLWDSNKKKSSKEKPIIGTEFHYVWKTKSTWARIVLYEWEITWYDPVTWICTCDVLDRNIEINPDRNIVEMAIPLSALKLHL